MNDDQLGRELRALVPTGWPVPPAGAAAAVRTARRRTAGRLLATSALVVAVAAGVPATLAAQTTAAPAPVASQPDGGPTVPPVPPLPVAEPTVAVSAIPVAPSVAPSAVPPVVSTPPAVPTEPEAPGTAPEPPATDVEPTEGPREGVVRGGELDELDFERTFGRDVERDFAPLPGASTWSWDVCDTGGPDVGRTGWWSFAEGTDSTMYDGTGRFLAEDHLQAASYVDEDAARAALADLRARTSCLSTDRDAASYWWGSSDAGGDVVQGAVHHPWTAMESPDDLCGFEFVRAVRDGRVIVLQQQVQMGSDCGWGSPPEEDAEQDHDPFREAVRDHLG